MTDEEVVQLYRALLGRDPESPDTVASFLAYYPSVERGRRAIFNSQEFEAFFQRVTGRTPAGRDPAAPSLALALLARAAAALPVPPSPPADDELGAGMRQIFAAEQGGLAEASFAVVVGQAADLSLDDLLPMEQPQSAVLHIAADFPPVVPLAGTLAGGAAVFRLGGDAASVSEIVRGFGRRIDALYLLGRPAEPGWVDALRGHFAQHALLLVGRSQNGWDGAALSAAIAAAHPAEPVQAWRGLHLHHVGAWLMPVTYDPTGAPDAPPDLAAFPKLAVAAIVRDEAACVENMLRSTHGLASFYAVLDTGSADGTQALAQGHLAGCGVPFAFAERDHTEFGDDFAAMRNAALAMVPDWVDWVLMLDADEELLPEDHGKLLALAASATHEAYALPRYNFPGPDKSGTMVSYPDRQVRLLRHTPDRHVRYSGAVHETVRGVALGLPPLDAAAMGGARGGPHIHHLVRRFRSPEAEERKQAFYREIASRKEAVLF